MKTAVVTGGSGFLGSHLCERLLAEGLRVYCVDNLCTGRLKNIEHLGANPHFTFVNQNVYHHVLIPGQVDFVFHFASPASPVDYLNMPIQTLKVGSIGTLNAIGMAKAKGARFLLASTSEVYGDPLQHPQPEDYWGNVNPIGPRGVYDEAKRFAEAMTMAYHRTHGLDTRIVRIFNTYGPRMRMDDGRALPTFFSQALRNEPLTVYGSGSQTRSFTYVSDEVEGIFRLMMSDVNEPVNIGNPEEATLIDVAQEIIAMTGSRSTLVYKDLPEDDPKVRCPDITRAKKLLNWEPKTCRKDGLSKTLEYFREELGLNTG